MIEQLLSIDSSKGCLKFLHNRVLSNDYRGVHISQHYRYDFDMVVSALSIFYNICDNEKMKLRTADLSKRPYNLPDEKRYAEYVSEVNRACGKGTQDSIRKLFFTDLHRMGLLNVYDKYEAIIDPYQIRPNHYASLTPLALELIDKNKSILEKHMLFSRCLDNLMGGMPMDMLEILRHFDTVTIDEYTFFISFLRKELNGICYNLDAIMEFIREYKSLSRFQRDEVVRVVKEYCNPNSFAGDKTDKRDFHNWQNESQQVFTLLNMTVYFEYNKQQQSIALQVLNGSLFSSVDDVAKLKRSAIELKNYFIEHNVKKRLGFELHHIIPLSWAKTPMQFFMLDKWNNILYIDAFNHAKISQQGNIHVRLEFDGNNALLSNFRKDNIIELINERNVLYDKDKQQILLCNNVELLNSFV